MLENDKIFGMSWEEIQILQQKGTINRSIKPAPLPMATEKDIALLEEIGIEGLQLKGFFGVIDRLQNSKLISSGVSNVK